MKDYNKIISKLRVIARDGLRLEAINRFRTSLQDYAVDLKNYKESKKQAEKCIAISEFIISKADPEDPRLEDIKEAEEQTIKNQKRYIVEYDRFISDTEEKMAEVKEKIAKIESGETLISKGKLAEVTSNLIETLVHEKAAKIVDGMKDEKTAEVDDEELAN